MTGATAALSLGRKRPKRASRQIMPHRNNIVAAAQLQPLIHYKIARESRL